MIRKLILALLLCSPAFATTYFVDNSAGLDSNNGLAKTTPWKHIRGMNGCTQVCATTNLVSGDTVIFKGGITWTMTGGDPFWTVTGGTTSMITYTTDHTWFNGGTFAQPVFDNNGVNAYPLNMIYSTGSFITLNDLKFTGCGVTFVPNNDMQCLKFENSHDIVLSNNSFNTASRSGVYFLFDPGAGGSFSNFTVTGNDFTNTTGAVWFASFCNAAPCNITMHNFVMHHNTAHDFASMIGGGAHGDGFLHFFVIPRDDTTQFLDGFQFYDNKSFGDFSRGIVDPTHGEDMSGMVYVEGPARGAIFNNILCYFPYENTQPPTAAIFEGVITFRAYNNPAANSIKVYNNTMCGDPTKDSSSASLVDAGYTSGMTIRNNISVTKTYCAFAGEYGVPANSTSNFNEYSCPNNGFLSWLTEGAGTIYGTGGVGAPNSNPGWVNVNAADVHLTSTSPGRGIATNLTAECSTYPALCQDFDGVARPTTGNWDEGALQFFNGGTTAAAPIFNPVPNSYPTAQNVAATTTSPGAIICTTQNGSTPTISGAGCGAGSTLYTGPIPITVTTTLKAIAGGTPYLPSAVTTGLYTITGITAATPVFSVAAGVIVPQAIGISTTLGSTICYNNTGAPTISGAGCGAGSTLYTGPVFISQSQTLFAIAGGTGFNPSPVASATYIIPTDRNTCGPPYYSCSNLTSTVIQTPTPPISTPSSTGTTCTPGSANGTGNGCKGSVGYDTSLNPAGHNPILRVTDGTVIGGHSPSSTPSGGDSDEIFNCAGRTDTTAACANATLYYAYVTRGAAPYLFSFTGNPLAIFNPVCTFLTSLGSSGQFSHTDPSVMYLLDAAGDPIIYKYTLSNTGAGSCVTGVQSVVYDVNASCPALSTLNATWGGSMKVSQDDTVFHFQLSDTGGQDTGVYSVGIKTGTGGGCSVYNISTGQILAGSTWGTHGAISPSTCTGATAHDSSMTNVDDWGHESLVGGTNCGATGGHTVFWQLGTTNVHTCTAVTSPGGTNICLGHDTSRETNVTQISNPSFFQFPPSQGDAGPFTAFGAINGNCENHFNGLGQSNGDTAPIIGASANQNQTWTQPGQNEVYALSMGGKLIRFTHDFILGPPTGCSGGTAPFDSYFNAQQAIGAASQDRRFFLWSSSMLGRLGTDSDAGVRADAFIVGLDSQQTIPSTLFGLHVNSANPWPSVNFGFLSLWDTGTRWQQMNPSAGTVTFTSLDTYLTNAKTHNLTDVVLTLSATPNYISSDPTKACDYSTTALGSCGVPTDIAATCTNVNAQNNCDGKTDGTNQRWKTFNYLLAAHVAGLGATFQKVTTIEIWNEFTRTSAWEGTNAQLVKMYQDANCIWTGGGSNCTAANMGVPSVGVLPTVTVTTPDSVLTAPEVTIWGNYLLTAGALTNADIAATHAYVQGATCCAQPETIITRYSTANTKLSAAGGSQPIWSTEGGWGQQALSEPDVDLQAAFVPRYYLLGWNSGFKRLSWYAWDNPNWGTLWNPFNVNGCNVSTGCITKAGVAYGQIYNWMVGSTLNGCSATGTVWICSLTKGANTYQVMWDSGQTCSGGTCGTLPRVVSANWVTYQDITTASTPIPITANTVPVGAKPIVLAPAGLTAPSFTPPGGPFQATVAVTINRPVGATTCFTTDLTIPTTNGAGTCLHGTTYVGPISVANNLTITAINTQSGKGDSAVASATYTFQGSAPTFNPPGNVYPASQLVNIANAQSLAMCVTQNGTTPSSNGNGACSVGTLYSGPLTINVTTTVKAVGIKAGWTDSPVGTATYVISVPPPSAIPASFFGLEELATGGTKPIVSFGTARLSDRPVSWSVVEASNGVFTYTNVDAILLQLKGGSGISDGVIYTVNVVPTWASSKPADTSCTFAAPGGCDLPADLAADGTGTNATFKAFITALATHVNNGSYLTTHAHIKYWEPWQDFWINPTVNSNFGAKCPATGGCSIHATYAQIVRMTEDMRCLITGTGTVNGVACAASAIDATAKILTPSSDGRNAAGWNIAENFLRCDKAPITGSQCITASRGFNAIDTINFHTYANTPTPSSAQQIVTQVSGIKSTITANDIAIKGLWSDEGGWGLNTALANNDYKTAFIAPYYLLGWSNGLGLMTWYEYENATTGTLCNAPANACVLNNQGVAYQQAYNWLVNKTLTTPCSGSNLWTCGLTLNGSNYQAMWDISQTCNGTGTCTTANQVVAAQWTTYQDMTTASTPIAIVNHTVPVGRKPIMLTTANPVLTVSSIIGSGTVSSSPAGISCPTTCSATFQAGTTVTLTATPNAGFVFAGWSGACSGTSTCVLTLTLNQSVGATFTTIPPPPPPTIINPVTCGTPPCVMPAGAQGQLYSFLFAATAGSPPYTWSVSSGSLPAGLSLNSIGCGTAINCHLGGTPSGSGTSSFTIKVCDTVPSCTTLALTLQISAAAVVISNPVTCSSPPCALTAGTQGSAYSFVLAAVGGTGPYTWTISSGTLPTGLALSSTACGLSTNCNISGTPTGSGTTLFTVRACDTLSSCTSLAVSLTVAALPVVITAPTCGTPPCALTAGTQGTAYTYSLTATGGTSPYVWSITAGALPPGVSVVGQTIAGTPTSGGAFSFTIQACDTKLSCTSVQATMAVAFLPPVITSPSCGTPPCALTTGNQAQAYSFLLVATGGVTPYTWNISSGTLPTGLLLNSNGCGTAVNCNISGTPINSGTTAFTVQVCDIVPHCTTLAVSLVVNASPVVITAPACATPPCALPPANQGAAYSFLTNATGGTGPYTWNISVGSLPTGLSLNSTGCGLDTNCNVQGTPTASGTTNFTIRACDTLSSCSTVASTIVVTAAPVVITNPTCNTPPCALTAADQGAAYSFLLGATGGTAPYTWTISVGTLPTGLSLNSVGCGSDTGCNIQGTPTASGTASFSVHVCDTLASCKTLAVTLLVRPSPVVITAPACVLPPCQLPAAAQNQNYSFLLGASGGTAPYTWNISVGILPAGMALDSVGCSANVNCHIKGSPSGSGTANFSVRVCDALSACVSLPVTLSVTAAAVVISNPVTCGTPPCIVTSGTQGSAYSFLLAAVGGTGPYTWSIPTGSLPASLSLSSTSCGTNTNCNIQGTPSGSGVSNFTIRACDTLASCTSLAVTLTIAALPISITNPTCGTQPCPLTDGTQGTPYTYTLTATGGTTPYTWSISSSSSQTASNFDDTLTGWGNCGLSCAGGTGSATAHSQTINNASPSLDGASMQLSVTGPALSAGQTTNYLWYYNAGANGTATNFISTWHAYIPSTSLIQELEFDTKQFQSGHRWFWGSECNPGGVWQIWDQLHGSWVTTTVSCTLTAATWHSIVWQLHRVPGDVSCSGQPCDYYDSLVVDGTNITPSGGFTPQPSGPSADLDNTGTDTQIDLNSTGGTATEFLDEMQFIASTAGTLPPGLSLNSSTGVISGTPSTSGAFNFSVQVCDPLANCATKSASLNIVPTIPVSITNPTCGTPPCVMTPGNQNVAYNFGFTATGGTSPYTWSIIAGTPPTGLALSSTGCGTDVNCNLVGTPSGSGTSAMTIHVCDTKSNCASLDVSLTIAPIPVVITSPSCGAPPCPLTNGVQNVVYSYLLQATGGTAPYTWSVISGSLPAGLSLSSTSCGSNVSCNVSGTPSQVKNNFFTVRACDSASNCTTLDVSLKINNPNKPAPARALFSKEMPYEFIGGPDGGMFTWPIVSGYLPGVVPHVCDYCSTYVFSRVTEYPQLDSQRGY